MKHQQDTGWSTSSVPLEEPSLSALIPSQHPLTGAAVASSTAQRHSRFQQLKNNKKNPAPRASWLLTPPALTRGRGETTEGRGRGAPSLFPCLPRPGPSRSRRAGAVGGGRALCAAVTRSCPARRGGSASAARTKWPRPGLLCRHGKEGFFFFFF